MPNEIKIQTFNPMSELDHLKLALALEIQMAIANFEAMTGVAVYDVEIIRQDRIGPGHPFSDLKAHPLREQAHGPIGLPIIKLAEGPLVSAKVEYVDAPGEPVDTPAGQETPPYEPPDEVEGKWATPNEERVLVDYENIRARYGNMLDAL